MNIFLLWRRARAPIQARIQCPSLKRLIHSYLSLADPGSQLRALRSKPKLEVVSTIGTLQHNRGITRRRTYRNMLHCQALKRDSFMANLFMRWKIAKLRARQARNTTMSRLFFGSSCWLTHFIGIPFDCNTQSLSCLILDNLPLHNVGCSCSA